ADRKSRLVAHLTQANLENVKRMGNKANRADSASCPGGSRRTSHKSASICDRYDQLPKKNRRFEWRMKRRYIRSPTSPSLPRPLLLCLRHLASPNSIFEVHSARFTPKKIPVFSLSAGLLDPVGRGRMPQAFLADKMIEISLGQRLHEL